MKLNEIKERLEKATPGPWTLHEPIDGLLNRIDTKEACYCVDPATIGQCTGLKDKNGKLIFEGDICKMRYFTIFTVTWDKANCRFIGLTSGPAKWKIVYVGREPAVEIIGNIHDNPELLKETGENE